MRIGLIVGLTLAYVLSSIVTEIMGNAPDLQALLGSFGGGSSSQGIQSFQLLVAERASAISNPLSEHSLLSRIELWRWLFSVSLDPFLGLVGRGIGALNADSLYVTYMAELGYPGLALILFVLGIFIYKGFSVLDTLCDPFALALARGILVMDLVLAIISITGTHIHYFPGDIYFWFFNGVLVRIETLDTPLIALKTT
jgi:hypothetical protein